MSEKEIKKIDEKGEEKISGGMKIDGMEVDMDKAKEILIKKGIDIKKFEDVIKEISKLPEPSVTGQYGAPRIHNKKLPDKN